MISRCSSPMPLITVWPISGSTPTRNDGSSAASLPSAADSFSWSALVFGSTATSITGSGNSMRSSTTWRSTSDSVSPVVVFLSPTSATMSPARASLTSSRRVGVHLQDAADALALALDRVHHVGAALDHARIDPDEGQRADERVGHDLEGERRRTARRRRSGARRPRREPGLTPWIGGTSSRRRQVVDDRVEQRLHALVLERRAAQHRHQLAGERALADAALERRRRPAPRRRDRPRAPRRRARPRSRSAHGAYSRGLRLSSAGIVAVLELGAERVVLPDAPPARRSGRRCRRSRPRAPTGSVQHQRRRAEPLLDHRRRSGRSRRRSGPSC